MADVDLPEAAQEAWQAYRAMEVFKRRHFDYSSTLEDRYGADARASAQEKEQLQHLPNEHDCRVFAFRQAVRTLKNDPVAYGALLDRLAPPQRS